MLKALAAKHPVFDSEMHFQLHLAWEMKLWRYEVRLEHDPKCFDANAAIDIIVIQPGRFAVELKYKTKRLDCKHGGEEFSLKNHSAQDCGRYDFWKDVMRLETLVAEKKATCGYAIFVTNDPIYWSDKSGDGTSYAAFRMHEGRTVTGTLDWAEHTGAGTKKHRERTIVLNSKYEVHWNEYADLGVKDGRFRYVLVEVMSPSADRAAITTVEGVMSREEQLYAIQQHFHKVIRQRAGDLIDQHNLALPELGPLLAGGEAKIWFPVLGMFGGFSYWLESRGTPLRLISESWCRVAGGSGQRHEITATGCRLVDEGFV